MKTFFFTITILLIICNMKAQLPENFKYQAVIRDGNGQLVSNTIIGLRISIVQEDPVENIVYIEEYSALANQYGQVNLEIGSKNTVDFTDIDWSLGTYFIKIEMDITGGNNYTEYGTSKLLSVPYALYAKSAENVFSGNYIDLTGIPDLSNYDDNIFDDFDGNYNNLTNRPDLNNYDDNKYDDFNGNYNSLSNKPDLSIYLTEETDSSVTNEIQTISKNGLIVTLSNKGGSVTDSVLTEAEVDAFVSNNGYALMAYVELLEEKLNELEAIYFGTFSLTDVDGTSYNTIKIGTQLWMAENLKAMHYANGDAIVKITDNALWNSTNTGAYSYYDNDSLTYADTYGALYNWYAIVDDRSICPSGWHIPNEAEWIVMENFLGGTGVAGGKMKETGTTHWSSPNSGATNESGFTGLPGGFRGSDGLYNVIGGNAIIWSSTEQDNDNSLYRYLSNGNSILGSANYDKNGGFSIRCIRD